MTVIYRVTLVNYQIVFSLLKNKDVSEPVATNHNQFMKY